MSNKEDPLGKIFRYTVEMYKGGEDTREFEQEHWSVRLVSLVLVNIFGIAVILLIFAVLASLGL